jgi:hypothetical protein
VSRADRTAHPIIGRVAMGTTENLFSISPKSIKMIHNIGKFRYLHKTLIKYLNIKHDHINWTISILSIALLLFYSVFSKFTKPQRQNHANNYNKLNGVFCIVTTILMFSCGDGVT